MTAKKFKKAKLQRQLNQKFIDPTLEKPPEADPDLAEKRFKEWRTNFLKQFSWHGGSVKVAA